MELPFASKNKQQAVGIGTASFSLQPCQATERWGYGEARCSPGLAAQRWQPAGIRKSGRARSPLVLLSGKECAWLPGAREGFAAFVV